MTPQRRKNTYKLSPVQEGLLFDELDAKDTGIDIGQIVCSMDEPLDAELLKSAWRQIVDRHEALRTSFHLRKGEEPHQNVHREVALPWNVNDLRALSGARQESELNRWLREDLKARFELDRDPLFRLNLFRLGDENWILVWTFHRGILDSRSVPIVLTEVFRTYDAARRSEALDLPNVRPYADYLQFLHSLEISESDKYWRKMLRGFASPTALGQLGCECGEEGYGEEEVQLSTTVTQALEELAIRERFTVNNAVQAAWAAALSRYNGTPDVVFGVTRPCRGFLPRAGSMVGTYSNTLPVRVKIPGTLSVFDLLRQIRASEIAVRDYEHTPLPRIQAWSELPLGSPLFASAVVFDHTPLNAQMKSPYLNWTKRQVRLHEQTNCPVTLYAYAEPALTLRLAYDRRRFGQGQIQQVLGHLETILKDIATGIDKSAWELKSLIKHESREAIVVRNETKTECPQDERIHERIEEQERAHPNAVLTAPPQVEPVVIAAAEDVSTAKAAPLPVEPRIEIPPADHALWSFLAQPSQSRVREKLPPVSVASVSVPVDAVPPKPVLKVKRNRATVEPKPPVVEHALPAVAPKPLVVEHARPAVEPKPPVVEHALPAVAPKPLVVEHARPAVEPETPVVEHAHAAVEPDPPVVEHARPAVAPEPPVVEHAHAAVEPDPPVVEHARPAVAPEPPVVEHARPAVEPETPADEHNRPAEPFTWATESPRKRAKVAARTKVTVKNRPALQSILRDVLQSAKSAARATASVKNCEFLKGTKGDTRPAARVKSSSAPQFVLRELLKSDCLPQQQPAENLEANRTPSDSGVAVQGNSVIVTIQPNGTKPPIFCIGALDGELNLFRTLSAGLGNDQPVYGLDPSGIKNDPAIQTNVKKIARYYIDQLRSAGQDQPYCLVGYSFGGLVALEMSQQLRASGAEVPATVLIDTHYPAGCRANEKLNARMHRYTDNLQQVLKRNSDNSSDHSDHSMFYSAMSAPNAAGSSQMTDEISKIQQRAADRYRTRPYPGRACIFTASTPLPVFDGGSKIGWDKIFNNNLSIYYEIPGDRGIINTKKHSALMVRRLNEFLGGVQESRVVPALSRIAS